MLGRRESEALVIGDITTGAEKDLIEATRLARQMQEVGDQRMHILTINAGSSSLKATVYGAETHEQPVLALMADRIGHSNGRVRIVDEGGHLIMDEQERMVGSHDAALRVLMDWIRDHAATLAPHAIGHRIVHGGRSHRDAERVTPEVLADLNGLVSLDPDHLPQALALIRTAAEVYPEVPHVACFDTSFHRSMARIAQLYPLPRRFADAGVIRYGFHGLSCESIMEALQAIDPAAARGRIIIAHLGNGASLTAVREGVSVDTTMGFTPTGGLMMGTRSGDLDPGVLVHLLTAQAASVAAVTRLVNRDAGLLGLSGLSGDMRDLLNVEKTDQRAADAVALFCYLARKALGALAAVLGGLDTVIFTAGIGEHAAPIRARICAGFEFLGLALEPEHNAAHTPVISYDGSKVVVRVMKTDEDLMIARHVRRVLQSGQRRLV
jgi:acetate kinase